MEAIAQMSDSEAIVREFPKFLHFPKETVVLGHVLQPIRQSGPT
jgi:hypothetical protein